MQIQTAQNQAWESSQNGLICMVELCHWEKPAKFPGLPSPPEISFTGPGGQQGGRDLNIHCHSCCAPALVTAISFASFYCLRIPLCMLVVNTAAGRRQTALGTWFKFKAHLHMMSHTHCQRKGGQDGSFWEGSHCWVFTTLTAINALTIWLGFRFSGMR